ncbi:MAG: stage III sporulation protein AE [Lachnospiraceae bacterium]|nr:stage III sporulation protein AE [Lachnospiraceae bacterium]
MGSWGKQKSGKILKTVIFSLILLFFCTCICVRAAENQEFSREEEALEELDLKNVETAVDQLLEEKQSMRGMIREMLTSGQAFSVDQWKSVIRQGVWDAMGIQKETCVHLLVLVILSAVFYHLSGVFQNNQIGDISFYMIYLLLFLLLLQAFDQMAGQMERLLEGVAVFMKALLPAYYIALTGACGVATATAFYQMILILIFLTEKVLLLFILPAIRVYLVLELINFLTKEEFLSKMTELLKNGILWALKSMVGVIVGIQLIQRLISPAVDTLKRSLLGRTAGALPGVGNLFSGITEVVLGSAVLIKNCLGAAAIVILLLAGVAPLCRMGISALVYQFLAALVQPVTDKRMVGCIHTMGESLGMLVRMLLTMEILFLLTIAILAGSLQ